MWLNSTPRFIPTSHVQALAELAIKNDMTVQIWRELSHDGLRYRVSVSAGYHGSAPNVCWQHVFPVDRPLREAMDFVAMQAWTYYSSTSYSIPEPHEGLLPQDIHRTRVHGHKHPKVRGFGRIETIWTVDDIGVEDVCGRFRDVRSWADHRDTLAAVSLPIVSPQAAPNLEAREEVRPTDTATIFRAVEGGVELVRARWWLLPWFHRGTVKEWKLTTFNARAETVATARTFKDSFRRRRCLVAADGWYEWTGPKGEKQRWLFTPRDGKPMMLAGLWDRCDTADQGVIESCTIVTQPSGSPLNAYHDRAPVVLFMEDWATWLDLHADVTGLMGPESADRFNVTAVS
jgi:putative SOS response-associated peptidase YedK